MAYKNISLSVEAYEALKRLQQREESFSAEILRLARTGKASDVAGVLSQADARKLSEGIASVRSRVKVKKWQS